MTQFFQGGATLGSDAIHRPLANHVDSSTLLRALATTHLSLRPAANTGEDAVICAVKDLSVQ